MEEFHYREGELWCEDVALSQIASQVGTPFYCYSAAHLDRRFRAYEEAFGSRDHLVCFAVKANSNLAVLGLLAGLGAGADIVSGGELYRALKAGISPDRIVYSGVGKSRREMKEALKAGIFMFNVESEQELEALSQTARQLGTKARIAFRVNPDVDPKTHPYISTGLKENKFGIPMERALAAYRRASEMEGIQVTGIDCHIGSQLTEIQPFLDAFQRLCRLIKELEGQGIRIEAIDIGGGLGIRYGDETPPEPGEYIGQLLETADSQGLDQTIIVEPGRSICGNAGALVTEVLYTKENSEKGFVIVDAAMNDLARPSLYQAYHEILPCRQPGGDTDMGSRVDIVGPICETGDFLAKARPMPPLAQGDLLAVMSAGAYGFTMSSNYNSRPRAAEVMVAGDRFKVVRRRESYEDLVRLESLFTD